MWKKIIVALLFVIVLFQFDGISWGATYELKLGLKTTKNSPEGEGVVRFIELVDEKSGGQLEIIPYWHESLGNAVTQIEGMMMGTQDMYFESFINYEHWVPEFKVHSVPYLFKDNDEYRQFLESDIERELEESLLKKTGIRILNEKRNWLRGPYRVIAATKPILTPKDCQGIELRQSGAGADVETWASFGARITTINWSETYLALKQEVVNAVTSPINLLYGMKFTEICKHVTRTNEFNQQLCFAINDKKFQSLPKEIRQIMIESINEAGEYESALVEEIAIKDIEKMKTEHGAKFYEPDIAPFQEKARALYSQFEKDGTFPPGLIPRIMEWQKGQ